MIWLSIAWRNLWRQGRRSLITSSAMAVSVGLCMATICLNDGTYQQLFQLMVVQQLGHIQVHDPDYPGTRSLYETVEDADAVLAEIEGHDEVVAAAPKLNGFGLVGGADVSKGAQFIGIDPDRERNVTPIHDRVVDGEWLSGEAEGSILLGHRLAEELEVGVGDEVVVVTQATDGSLGNLLYTVKGTFRTGNNQMDKGGAYLHLADFQSLWVLPDQVHEITLITTDADNLTPVAEVLREAHPDLLVRPWQDVSPETASLMSVQDGAAFFMVGLVFLVASFGVVNTMLVSVFERTREFGVMRALGVGPLQLVQMVIIESVLLASMAAVGGLVLGGGLDAYLIFNGFDLSASLPDGLEFNGVVMEPVIRGAFRPAPVVFTLLTLIVVSALAAIWPAFRAATIQPVDAIRE